MALQSPPAPLPVPGEGPVPDPEAGAWAGLTVVLVGGGVAGLSGVSLAVHGLWVRFAELLEGTAGGDPGDPEPPAQWTAWMEAHTGLASDAMGVAAFEAGFALLLGLVILALGVGVMARWDACRKGAQAALGCKALAAVVGMLIALFVTAPRTSAFTDRTARLLRDLPEVRNQVDLASLDSLSGYSVGWTIVLGLLGVAIPLACLFMLRGPSVRQWCGAFEAEPEWTEGSRSAGAD